MAWERAPESTTMPERVHWVQYYTMPLLPTVFCLFTHPLFHSVALFRPCHTISCGLLPKLVAIRVVFSASKSSSVERNDSFECRASGHPVVSRCGPHQGGGFVKNCLGQPCGPGVRFFKKSVVRVFRPFGHSPLAYLYRIPSEGTRPEALSDGDQLTIYHTLDPLGSRVGPY